MLHKSWWNTLMGLRGTVYRLQCTCRPASREVAHGWHSPRSSQRFRHRLVAIFGPHDGLVFSHQTAREFMIAVFALVGETFVQSGSQPLPSPTLRLRQPLCCLAQFVGMGNLLATGQCEQVMKAWINAYGPSTDRRNGLGWCVDVQAQIPAGSSLDDA